MKNVLRTVAVLALVALIAVPISAQDDGRKKGKKTPAAGRGGGTEAQILNRLESIDLSAEQKEKVKTILATYRPKLERLAAAITITPEQRRAAGEARKAAAAEGKKGKELQEASQAAMKLSEDQIAARKKQQEVMQVLRKEITDVLTAEQQEKFRGKRDATPGKKRKK